MTDNTAGIIGGIAVVVVVLILSITTAVIVIAIALAKNHSNGVKTKEQRLAVVAVHTHHMWFGTTSEQTPLLYPMLNMRQWN